MRTYAPLLDALRSYAAEGWQIEILPWVVGVSGLLVKASTRKVQDFLSIPRKNWDNFVKGAAIASVKAFYFLHQVLCKALHPGNPAKGRHSNFDTDDQIGRGLQRDTQEVAADGKKHAEKILMAG